jgi:hypothetical protein
MRRASTVELRRFALRIALAADCDERTATKAIEHGPDSIRTLALRERVRAVMRELGLLEESP